MQRVWILSLRSKWSTPDKAYSTASSGMSSPLFVLTAQVFFRQVNTGDR